MKHFLPATSSSPCKRSYSGVVGGRARRWPLVPPFPSPICMVYQPGDEGNRNAETPPSMQTQSYLRTPLYSSSSPHFTLYSLIRAQRQNSWQLRPRRSPKTAVVGAGAPHPRRAVAAASNGDTNNRTSPPQRGAGFGRKQRLLGLAKLQARVILPVAQAPLMASAEETRQVRLLVRR